MCGITGGIWSDPRLAVEASVLERMTEVLAHRGPDDRGLFRSDLQRHSGRADMPGVALGHRRLAVIDLDGGRQPMANEDGSVQVVFNGEIYNHADLRRRLEGNGHRLHTHCDTEVLPHLWEDLGPGMLEHLEGMFALAVFDARDGRLMIARDRLGQKPLFYREESGRLLFGSELKSLLEVPGVPREVDPGALDAYLTYQYVPHPQCILRGFAKLPPAHFALWHGGRLKLERYWSPNFNLQVSQPRSAWEEQLRALADRAVRRRLIGDVPLGAFLSGGLDSTLISALAARHIASLGGDRLRTFSIGFPVPEYDETHFAQLAARHIGTEHREFRVEPRAVEILPRLVWHYDEPLGDSSVVPTWYLSQLTRGEVTVALSGDGGDELFAGYDRYRAVWLAGWFDRLPALRSALGARCWQRLPSSARQKSVLRRWRRFSEALALPPARRYLEWIAIFGESRRGALYTDDYLARLPEADPADFVVEAVENCSGRDQVTAASLADLVTYLPCDLNVKVDIASMAHGLECRQPLLDHQLVELAAAMPIGEKFARGRGKRILHRVFADLIPVEIIRRGKMGFGVPLDHWFRAELKDYAHDVLLQRRAIERGYFCAEAVRAMLEAHVAGRFDHSARLWSLLMLELWHRAWIDA